MIRSAAVIAAFVAIALAWAGCERAISEETLEVCLVCDVVTQECAAYACGERAPADEVSL